MKLILVAAISSDGFLTKGNDPDVSKWLSKEDRNSFSEIIKKYRMQVMGINTFLATRLKPSKHILRIILTKKPKEYSEFAVPGQIEFHNLSPEEFVKRYEKSYKSCLVLGGSQVYTEFLKAGLISEAFITIEPKDHDSGIKFLADSTIDLVSLFGGIETTELNESGTVLKHYTNKILS